MKSTVIIGATSGLGEGLAREFARRGHQIAMTGRRVERLESLQQQLQPLTPKVVIETLDITDYAAVEPVLDKIKSQLGNIDTIIVTSGVGPTLEVGSQQFDVIQQAIDTNLTGAVACFDAAIRLFKYQGHGQLVGVSSVAAIRGMAKSGIYSATKAAVSRYLESARVEMVGNNITITDLCPGYIDTDMNAHLNSRPFLISAEKGVRVMADKIEKKVGFSYIPVWPWMFVAKLLRLLPTKWLA